MMKKIILILFASFLFGITFSSHAQKDSYLKNKIMIEGFYIRNLGNFSEFWASAAGAYLGYSIAFLDHNLLIMRAGFVSNTLKEGLNYQDASSTIIPFEIGGRYYFIDSRIMPFVQFMNGINLIFENTNLEGEKEDKTLLKYAWQVGLGLTVNLVSNINFDVGVNYQSNFYKTEAMNTGFKYVFGIGLAL